MWFHRRQTYNHSQAYMKRVGAFVDQHFQLRYTRYVFTVAILSAFLFLLPMLFFTNQNYGLFIKLSDLMSPDLAKYLAKEQFQLNLIFALTLIAYGIFWFSLGKKITAKIAGPAKVLRNHIRQFGRGNYAQDVIRIREDDEFKDLINTYNYFVTLLKAQNERELETLRTVLSTITNPVAHELILALITEREMRLAQKPDDGRSEHTNFLSGEEPGATHGSRHAS